MPCHPDRVRRHYAVLTPEEAAQRTGAPVALLRAVQTQMNHILNDADLKRRVNAQFYSGKIADVTGFDWFMEPNQVSTDAD